MKNLVNYINEADTDSVMHGEAFIDLKRVNDDEYLQGEFLTLIDDAVYNLYSEHGVNMTCADVAKIVTAAMDKYKNFK